MARQAHHRADFRGGRFHGKRQQQAYNRTKLGGPAVIGLRMQRLMETRQGWGCVGVGTYRFPSVVWQEFWERVRQAEPFVTDTEGTVWE